ncbi:MAG: thiol-disulfide isomerase/thioredoxin [Natrialbaceae archaeon]|jgi:thiol-disulfide isomerase/thioredoxin
MNRRQLLAGFAGAAGTAGGLWIAMNGLSSDGALPVRIETIDAPGSTPGEMRVPISGEVTVIDLFATWCAPCETQMDRLTAVHREFGQQVRFVSVTNERLGETLTRDDLREWWQQHDGNWSLGLDPESQLMGALNAGGIPFHAVATPDGAITWKERGLTSEDTLRTAIQRAIDDE